MSLLFWRRTRDVAPQVDQAVAVDENNALPVRPISHEDDDPLRVQLISPPGPLKEPSIYNITLTSADTEYSQVLPSDCRLYEWQCRTAAAVRWALETGRVATPTAPYDTLKANDAYTSAPLSPEFPPPRILYFASATAGVVVELTVWR